jgi:hypothetical protein
MTPLGPAPTADDVPDDVVALSSDLTGQVTRAVLTVDGGMTTSCQQAAHSPVTVTDGRPRSRSVDRADAAITRLDGGVLTG